MKQLLLLAVALLVGTVVSQPCAPQSGKWMSPLNLQGPRYNPQYKPLHVFSFLDGGEGLVLENTGDSVSITYPIRPNINSSPPNLTDIQISKGPLADHYTADHVEFRWGPAVLPVHPSSSSTGAGAADASSSTGSAGPDSSSTGTFFLEVGAQARAEWGSDHAFSGRYFPLEMQIFFYNTKYKTYAEALAASPQEPDHRDVNEDVVALSVLFEVGAQNEELVKITDRLDNIQTSGATTPILAKMCFEKILNKGRDFITYPGSLTRAPCTRGVRWIVLVETLTVSQSQLDQFRLINLDAPEWLEPLDQPLVGRLVETNLKELPLDDKFIPAFHPHGPPLNVIDPKVGGTVINEFATDAEDAAYKNYWSPFDYTIVDDAVTPPVEATAEASTTEVTATGGVTADTTEPPADTAATGGGGGATAGTGPTAFMLAEQSQTAATAATAGGGGATVLPAPTADGTASSDESSTGNAAQQPDDKPVKIPNFFHLSTVAYFTPDFAPRQHRHQEDNHYHPPSLGDPATGVGADSAWMPDTEESFKGKKEKEGKGALNPIPAPAAKAPAAKVAPLPQLKEKLNKQAKAAAAKPAVAVDPKTAFLKGKRPAQK